MYGNITRWKYSVNDIPPILSYLNHTFLYTKLYGIVGFPSSVPSDSVRYQMT